MVPSSTTVTPGEAIRLPIRPANAEVFLRLKSPSSPWPIASCSRMPGQPEPSTTGISPAGAGRLSRLTSAWRKRLIDRATPGASCGDEVVAKAAARAVTAGFAPAALLHHDRDVQPHQRPQVGDARAVGAHDLHRLPFAADRGHHLLDPRILAARIGVDLRPAARCARRNPSAAAGWRRSKAGVGRARRFRHRARMPGGDRRHGRRRPAQRFLGDFAGVGDSRSPRPPRRAGQSRGRDRNSPNGCCQSSRLIDSLSRYSRKSSPSSLDFSASPTIRAAVS